MRIFKNLPIEQAAKLGNSVNYVINFILVPCFSQVQNMISIYCFLFVWNQYFI